MHIFVTGDEERSNELTQRLGEGHDIHYAQNLLSMSAGDFDDFDVIFDLNMDENPDHLLVYGHLEDKTVVGCAVKASLAEMMADCSFPVNCRLIGFNALPTFISRDRAEVSLADASLKDVAEGLFAHLQMEVSIVDDRVGMVTPRIIFMIINEAFYTVQEGTATAEDIDQSMKLGTNYPYGPFEWSERTGIRHIYEVLTALYVDTQDERYKVCPLLKKKYLKEGRTQVGELMG